MSNIAISVEQLSKQYVLGLEPAKRTLREALSEGARNFLRQSKPDPKESFWALKDVSFEIKEGERVGIIGRNGAGKSTMLKVLSRITEPTTGRIRINGRVASLLEVGTGFHPELTGRENIFLNSAILGMGKAEIRRKFDEIVAFSEVERFLDTPVKRYSSGMYVRLAFAVAAHLEPEILIVDEVLAVGDAQFQKKCLGKMEEVGRDGRTVIFVSHNMSTVEALCERGILLQSGSITLDGDSKDAIDAYLSSSYALSQNSALANRKDRSGSGKVRSTNFRILDSRGFEVSSPQSGDSYDFEITCENKTDQTISNVVFSLDFFDEKENTVLLFRTNFSNSNISLLPGTNKVKCRVQDLPLAVGTYRLSFFLSYADSEVLDYIRDAASFTVAGGDFFGTGSPGLSTHCKILCRSSWSVSSDQTALHMNTIA